MPSKSELILQILILHHPLGDIDGELIIVLWNYFCIRNIFFPRYLNDLVEEILKLDDSSDKENHTLSG